MSALQKYKKKAQELEEENKVLRQENEKLKGEKSLEIVGDIEDALYEASNALTIRLIPLAYDCTRPFSRHFKQLMVAIIEEALHKAYEQGSKS
ncbi:hypothetical protein LCGC14_0479360 [marine sediment metagenome]|uniref:Uncharacterized protein n=1 Tax=marine sediment metagenome TaxID=412755 RepID=A0A0F9S9P9_9ZZZZ